MTTLYLSHHMPHEYRRPAKRYPFRGTWMSIPEISKATGIHDATIRGRIKAGRPIEERARAGRVARQFLFRGQWVTVNQIATLLNVTTTTVYKRISGETVLDNKGRRGIHHDIRCTAIMIFYKGENRCASDWARHLGMKPSTFHSRMRQGWTMERIISEPVRKRISNKSMIARLVRLFRLIANSLHLQRIVSAFKTTRTQHRGAWSAISQLPQKTGEPSSALERGNFAPPNQNRKQENAQ